MLPTSAFISNAMYAVHAALEVSRTVFAAATCLYFLGALLKQVETRKRNAVPFIWLLVAMLLVSVTEAAVMIIRSGGLPNIQPIAATLLYILGLLLQIDHLWTPTNEEEKPAWHALLGSCITMVVFELLTIVELAVVPHSSTADVVCGAVATSLRFCLEVVLFIMFAWPDQGGYIRLSNSDAVAAVEDGTTTVPSNGVNGERGKRLKLPALKQSVRNEIAGGTWPWVKKFRIFLPWIWPSSKPWMVLHIVVALLLQQVETAITLYEPHLDGAFVESVMRAYEDRNLIPVWKALGMLLLIRFANSDGGISIVRDLIWQSFENFREMQAQTSIYAHLMGHEAAFYDATDPADIINAIKMSSTVCRALDFILLDVGPQIITFIGASTTVFLLYGPHVALVQFMVTAIYALIVFRSNRMLMPMYDERMTAFQNTKRRYEDGLRGWRTVNLYGQAGREIEAHASNLGREMDLVWKSAVLRHVFRFSSNLAITPAEFAAIALVILYGLRTGGTVGSVIAFRGYWNLSGGERQRVALARTLISPASVKLLDEATSALDADSEAHIKKTIKTVFADKTIVIIAHRLSSIKDADKIVVFKKGEESCGEIAEEGKHDELLKRDGIYARLWRKHIGAENATREETSIEGLYEQPKP